MLLSILVLGVFLLETSAFHYLPTRLTSTLKLACRSEEGSEGQEFAQSFVTQKNFILLGSHQFIAFLLTHLSFSEKLQNPEGGNLTATAHSFVNFCDESFDIFLNERIANTDDESSKQALGKVRYEINRARQSKLMGADRILRDILSAGGLKQMEAKLQYYLRRSEIDMAFNVILRLNIEDAVRANVTTAVQIMTHLETLINEHQDALVSPPVKLLRLLVRTEDPQVRLQMLRQKLILSDADEANRVGDKADEARATASPQCEHIVVAAVPSWGGKDVRPHELEDTIADIRAQVHSFNSQYNIDMVQMCGFGEDEGTRNEMELKCQVLLKELQQVIEEASAPKTVDACDMAESNPGKLLQG